MTKCANGDKYWYLNGKDYTFGDWLEQVIMSDEGKIMLALIYA